MGKPPATAECVGNQRVGPYYKDEELLEFGAELEPTGRVGDCVAVLKSSAATGWDDSPVGPAWARLDDGTTFLHPPA